MNNILGLDSEYNLPLVPGIGLRVEFPSKRKDNEQGSYRMI